MQNRRPCFQPQQLLAQRSQALFLLIPQPRLQPPLRLSLRGGFK